VLLRVFRSGKRKLNRTKTTSDKYFGGVSNEKILYSHGVGYDEPCFTEQANVTIQYDVGADDYMQLFIDGALVAAYDNPAAQGGDSTELLSLSEGWHDITLIYKNRVGSNGLQFRERESLDGCGMTFFGAHAVP